MVAICNRMVFDEEVFDDDVFADEALVDDGMAAPASHLRRAPAGLRRPPAAVYRRRRLAAGLVAAVVALLLAGVVGPALGDPTTTSLAAGDVHVVRPGDTYWSIAALLDTDGDIRDTVAALAADNGDRALQVGDRIQLPT